MADGRFRNASFFYQSEFRFTRISLRFFGFWHPIQARMFSKLIYPIVINVLFLLQFLCECVFFVTACAIFNKGATYEFLLELSVRLTLGCSYWLMHCLTFRYFKTRDVEDNILDMPIDKSHLVKFRTRINMILLLSHLVTILVTGLSIKTGILDHFPAVWSAKNATKIDKLNDALRTSNYFEDPWNFFCIPVSLTLTWIMYILFETSQFRLSQLTNDFLKWQSSPEDAIYHHITYYSSRIKKSSSKITALFFTHNILMIILIPQFMYLCVLVGRKKSTADFVAFVTYFLVIFASWIVPLIFAEGIRSNELSFKNEINKFCKGYIKTKCKESDAEIETRTFAKRENVERLISYLKERKTGIVMWGFAFQLKLSVWSFYLGLILFVFKIAS